jgi:hypothetical protein
MKKYNDMMDQINTPQFPGQQVKGFSIEQIRTLIKKQQRVKGYAYSVATGTNDFNIQLSGNARIFLGIALIPRISSGSNYGQGFNHITSMSFKINNEIIIETIDPNFMTYLLTNDEYYYLPRPLSGTDQITITFQNPGATELANLIIYYI